MIKGKQRIPGLQAVALKTSTQEGYTSFPEQELDGQARGQCRKSEYLINSTILHLDKSQNDLLPL
jgi:hypothetical protein